MHTSLDLRTGIHHFTVYDTKKIIYAEIKKHVGLTICLTIAPATEV